MKSKKLKTLIALSVVLGSASAPVLAAESKSSTEFIRESNSKDLNMDGITSANVNIRVEPSTSSEVVGRIAEGIDVKIIAKNNNWYKVTGDVEGYVSADYIDIKGESVEDTVVRAIGRGKVINVSTNLNIRKSASTSSEVVGKIPANAEFDIIKKSGNWYKIKYKAHTGYVSADYVKVLNPPTGGGAGENTGGDDTQYGKGKVVNVSTNLNIRKSASTSSEVVGKIPANAEFDIIQKSGNWYKIKYKTHTGYVSADYVKVLSPSTGEGDGGNTGGGGEGSGGVEALDSYGKVVNVSSGSRLRVRKSPSSSSDVLGYLSPNQKVKIVGKTSGWYKISYGSGHGFVGADYVQIIEFNPDGELDETAKAKYDKIYAAMTKQLGSPYVYGGSGELITRDLIDSLMKKYPNQSYSVPDEFYDKDWRAFDCSGLLYWGFKEAGVNLSRSTSTQINDGVEVSKDDLQPGDLIFYKTLNHVGMYIGDDKWIESPRTGLQVRITNVPWTQVERIRRVL